MRKKKETRITFAIGIDQKQRVEIGRHCIIIENSNGTGPASLSEFLRLGALVVCRERVPITDPGPGDFQQQAVRYGEALAHEIDQSLGDLGLDGQRYPVGIVFRVGADRLCHNIQAGRGLIPGIAADGVNAAAGHVIRPIVQVNPWPK